MVRDIPTASKAEGKGIQAITNTSPHRVIAMAMTKDNTKISITTSEQDQTITIIKAATVVIHLSSNMECKIVVKINTHITVTTHLKIINKTIKTPTKVSLASLSKTSIRANSKHSQNRVNFEACLCSFKIHKTGIRISLVKIKATETETLKTKIDSKGLCEHKYTIKCILKVI